MVENKTFGSRLFDILNYVILGIIAILCLYPLWHVLMGSFSDPKGLTLHTGILLKPEGFSTAGYRIVLSNPNILTGYMNTLVYVVVGTIVRMIMTILGAYALSRSNFLLKRALSVYVVITMYFGGGLIASFLVVTKLFGMYDSRAAIIVPSLISTWNMIILKTAFQRVPASLEESARLDGANDIVLLIRIILPVSMATIAVLVLYYAVSEWNSWFTAVIYLRSRNKFPLQVFLRETLISYTTSMSDDVTSSMDAPDVVLFIEKLVRYSTIIVATVPILCIYPFAQRYFITGVMMGSLKE